MANPITTPLYDNLDTHMVIDLNYPNVTLFRHAVRLYIMSYPEFDHNRVEEERFWHSSKFIEYIQCIGQLYGGIVHNDWQFLTNIYHHTRGFIMTVSVKGFRGGNNCQSMSFRVIEQSLNRLSSSMALDPNSEVQTGRMVSIQYQYHELQEAKRQNHPLVVRIVGGGWALVSLKVVNEELEEFRFGLKYLHPEGFQDWVYFGRGICLLIEVLYRAVLTQADRRQDFMDFHVHTIHRMITARLAQSRPAGWHQFLSGTNRVTCRRPLAYNTSSMDMYWRRPGGLNLEQIRKWYEREDPEAILSVTSAVQDVNYFELQRSLISSEDFEERVCLCNEWCNWSAFFHFNPIYRFIVLMNSQLFLANVLGCPELYALASQVVLTQQHQSPRCGYVLRLLFSAEHYRVLFWHKYIGQSPAVRHIYGNNNPNPYMISALNYKKLRDGNAIPIGRLCRHFAVNPLADICVQNLLQYYTLLERLHHWVANHGQLNLIFVIPNRIKNWNHDFDNNYRKPIAVYLKTSYDQLFQAQDPLPDPTGGPAVFTEREAVDKIFGSDIEYLQSVPESDGAALVKYRRLRSIGSVGNLFNVSVTLDPFLNAFISIYKFITRIDHHFKKPKKLMALVDNRTYLTTFDRDFQQQFNTRQQSVRISLSVNDLTRRRLKNKHRKCLFVFYTLKLYSFAFVIQKHCFEIRGRELKKDDRQAMNQIADQFNFIERIDVIEQALQAFQTLNQKKPFHLFKLSNTMVRRYRHFFDNFWGPAPHEAQNQQNYLLCAQSACAQYLKLFVFLRNNGLKKPRFTTIFLALRHQLPEIMDRSQDIFIGYIIGPLRWLEVTKRYADTSDVMDVLAVYLVRAACFIFTRLVCLLFRAMKRNQSIAQIRNDTSYSMGKPGWTELLKSRNILIPQLDILRAEYAIYDDELERIAKTLDDFWGVTKLFYREYYKKLSMEWLEEMTKVFDYTIQSINQHHPTPALNLNEQSILARLMVFQLAVGTTFTAAFHQQFRYSFYKFRKELVLIMNDITQSANLGQHMMVAAYTRPVIRQYLRESVCIKRGQPFNCHVWYNHLTAIFPVLLYLTPAQVNLNMADVYTFIK